MKRTLWQRLWRRIARLIEALRHDPAPWWQPSKHRRPRHGAEYISFQTGEPGERWRFDARRQRWVERA